MAEEKPEFTKTIVTIAELSEDEKIRERCWARERYELDYNSAQRYGYETGHAAGLTAGLTAGRTAGRTESIHLISQLCDKLTEAGRIAELGDALKEEALLNRLLNEFGLKQE